MNKKTVKYINVEDLFFDLNNPRISEFSLRPEVHESEIIGILWDAMGAAEIALSIKASGFFDHEPLIAVREGGRNIVIEGNRRLAAVKCILSPDYADRLGINKNLLSVSRGIRNDIEKLPVIFVNKREEAWKFIGFKHINGPAKWGSYAKAQYISQIKNDFGIPLAQIASQIGDTHNTVQRLYQGLKVIEQAEKWGVFDRTNVEAGRLYFSHLYTGLTYEGFREYIGISSVTQENERPVPDDKREPLGELLTWIYGSRKEKRRSVIQSQNPDLRRLEAVLKSREALHALQDGVSLAAAFDISQPKNQTFEQSLLEAKRALQKAQTYQTEGFDGTDTEVLTQAGTVASIAEDLYEAMEKKWKELNETASKKRRLFGGSE